MEKVFNQEEVIELCEHLGIETVPGNIPLMNGKPIDEESLEEIIKKEEIRYDEKR